MKKLYFFLLLSIGLLIAGCSANTYSALRGREDGLIGDFIHRNQLNIRRLQKSYKKRQKKVQKKDTTY